MSEEPEKKTSPFMAAARKLDRAKATIAEVEEQLKANRKRSDLLMDKLEAARADATEAAAIVATSVSSATDESEA